jgi:hypothetical protein
MPPHNNGMHRTRTSDFLITKGPSAPLMLGVWLLANCVAKVRA